MIIYNRYLVTLALLFTTTTVLLAVYGQNKLDLYLSIYLIELLGATLIFAHLHPRVRRSLGFISYILFAGFLAIIATKVFGILVETGAFL